MYSSICFHSQRQGNRQPDRGQDYVREGFADSERFREQAAQSVTHRLGYSQEPEV